MKFAEMVQTADWKAEKTCACDCCSSCGKGRRKVCGGSVCWERNCSPQYYRTSYFVLSVCILSLKMESSRMKSEVVNSVRMRNLLMGPIKGRY